MNFSALSILFFLLIVISAIKCNENRSDRGTNSSGGGTKTKIGVKSEYICEGNKYLKRLTAEFSYDGIAFCTGSNSIQQNAIFNITLCNRIIPLNLYNVLVETDAQNGYTTFNVRGKITETICAGADVQIFNYNVPDDKKACTKLRSLSSLHSEVAFFKIIGGKCNDTCFGRNAITYSPPVSKKILAKNNL